MNPLFRHHSTQMLSSTVIFLMTSSSLFSLKFCRRYQICFCFKHLRNNYLSTSTIISRSQLPMLFEPKGSSPISWCSTKSPNLEHRLFSIQDVSLSSSDDKVPNTTKGLSPIHYIRPKSPANSKTASNKLQLLSFYRFVQISNPEVICDTLAEKLEEIPGLLGTVYVAKEGVNAQFSVPVGDPLKALLEIFGEKGKMDGACLPFDTFAHNPPNLGDVVDNNVRTFDKLIVRTRDFILRDGMISHDNHPEIESLFDWSDAGVELLPEEWDAQLRPLISSSNSVQLLDCRNGYESELGTFVSSIPLSTNKFSDTLNILDSQVKSQSLDPTQPIFIYCTGGIRCVKVGAYLKQRLGFCDVRSLRQGIIGYEKWWNNKQSFDSSGEITEKEMKKSLWVGENFQFNKRRLRNE